MRIFSSNTGYADLIYNSTTSNVTISLPTKNGNLQSCTNLYNNTSGTTGTVTLSETSANFSYLEIFYMLHNGKYKSVRIYSPNGKNVQLDGSWATDDGTIQINTKLINISGTSVTNAHSGNDWYSNLTNGNATISVGTQTSIKIVRIDGYR